jgi:alkanesulfonate monooxygenase SsuD/methylene tetrahydromethanopterin reductase-like flavin-dependent oxidoreductase (luciferase family)
MRAGGDSSLPSLGLTLPQFSTDPGPALAAGRDACRLGFGGVFVFDHLWPLGGPRTRAALECWTLLAAVAAAVGRRPPEGSGGPHDGPAGSGSGSSPSAGAKDASEDREGSGGPHDGPAGRRAGPVPPEVSGGPQGGAPVGRGHGGFRVGTLVTRAGLRAPALVARMAATVGQLAGAPPIVGVGRGDPANRDENLAFGLPYGDGAERAAALEATVVALRGPLAAGAEVWVGGVGAGARELAGRLADAWNGWALTPEELAAGLADARRAAEAAGRDPAAVAGTWGGQVLVAPERAEAEARLARWGADRPPAEVARVVAGDPDTVLGRLGALGRAGAAWCVAATVGGQAAEMRALLAAAAGLPARTEIS